jgi:flagellar protein FlaG
MNISSSNTTSGYSTDKMINSGPVRDREVNISKVENTTSQVKEERLNEDMEKIIKSLKGHDITVERSIHKGTNNIMYKLMDKESGEIILELPREQLLDMATRYIELSGIVIDEKI